MLPLARGLGLIDLHFQGYERIIATAVLHSAAGVALIDPGPSTCLPRLGEALASAGWAWSDVRWILLTHIHLDHAGATGSIVRAAPAAQVFVHARGAPHLVDPSRLLASARRLYGATLEPLFGAVEAVPAANVRPLEGGEQLPVGDRTLEVASTPGHAVHHVSYFDPASRVAFVGDTGGIRIDPARSAEGAVPGRADGAGCGWFVMPPTPPPDIDLEAWAASRARILAWRPATLFVTHFGPYDDPPVHLAALEEHLAEAARLVRATLVTEGTDEDRIARFTAELGRYLRRYVPDDDAVRYERAAPPWQCWLGLARYWRRREPHLAAVARGAPGDRGP